MEEASERVGAPTGGKEVMETVVAVTASVSMAKVVAVQPGVEEMVGCVVAEMAVMVMVEGRNRQHIHRTRGTCNTWTARCDFHTKTRSAAEAAEAMVVTMKALATERYRPRKKTKL